jgi:hypothetical protein
MLDFELPPVGFDSLRCQISTLKKAGSGQHRKYLPLIFTEQGVAMLSSVLGSERAVNVNIAVIRNFVESRLKTIAPG